jgi:hypothetical protein
MRGDFAEVTVRLSIANSSLEHLADSSESLSVKF